MTRVLFDTNVILDVLLRRHPFVTASALAVNAAIDGVVEGLVAAHAVTTISYILARHLGTSQTRATLADLLLDLRIAAVTDEGVRLALVSRIRDFEDAVTDVAAAQAGASAIVTRDIGDFAGSTLRVLLPEAFVASLPSSR